MGTVKILGSALMGVLFVASASAQNLFEVYPGEDGEGTLVVRRGSFRDGQGAVYQQYPSTHYRGIGDDGTGCSVSGFAFLIQDQERTTSETWTFAVRRGTTSGPELGAAGTIFAVSASTPPNPGGSHGIVWSLTIVPATPVVIPCDDEVFVGHELPAQANWPLTDGLAPWVYRYSQDVHLTGRPNHAWEIVGDTTTGTVGQPEPQAIHVAMLTPCPVLTTGTLSDPLVNPDQRSPDFGPSGMYPDVSRGPNTGEHGLVFRVRDRANANGLTVLFLGRGFGTPFSIADFGGKGSMWLLLDGQLTFGDDLDADGGALITRGWMRPRSLHRFAGGAPTFQAFTFQLSGGVSNVRLSNGVSPQL